MNDKKLKRRINNSLLETQYNNTYIKRIDMLSTELGKAEYKVVDIIEDRKLFVGKIGNKLFAYKVIKDN